MVAATHLAGSGGGLLYPDHETSRWRWPFPYSERDGLLLPDQDHIVLLP
jgi:hypothetical protein